jgi:hypothetical protein
MKRVYEVNTVERVERRYLVELTDKNVADDLGIPLNEVTEEERKVYAEEQVTSGDFIGKFTEGNADIEEVLEVKEQT